MKSDAKRGIFVPIMFISLLPGMLDAVITRNLESSSGISNPSSFLPASVERRIIPHLIVYLEKDLRSAIEIQ